jgi:hypothetical protein
VATVAVAYAEAESVHLEGLGRVLAEERASHVMDALVNGPRAWLSTAELAAALGWPVESVESAVDAGESLGWLARWDDCPAPVGPSVTLSSLSAEMLGVVVGPDAAFHPGESPAADEGYGSGRRIGQADRARGTVADDEPGGWLRHQIDPRAIDPAAFAEEAEEVARLASNPHVARLLNGTAMPTRVIGIRPPWPVTIEAGWCPACGSGPTEVGTACIACDRSGLDLLIGRPGR